MKFTILQPILARMLEVTYKAVDSRPSLPILSNLLIYADGGGLLYVTGTNLEISVLAQGECESVEEAGSYTLPAQMLVSWVASLNPRLPVSFRFDAKSNSVLVTSGKTTSSIRGIPSADFPSIPSELRDAVSFSLPASDFCSALRSTLYAAAPENAILSRTTLQMEFKGKLLTMVAADGYRMARRVLTSEVEFPSTIAAMISASRLALVERIFSSYADNIAIAFGKNSNGSVVACFESQEIAIYVQVMEGAVKIAGAESLLTAAKTEAVVNAKAFSQVLRRARIFAQDSNFSCRMVFKTENVIEIYGSSDERGQSEDMVEAQVTGSELTIGENLTFLLDAIDAFEQSESLTLRCDGVGKALVFTSDAQSGLIAAISPVTIKT